MGSRLHEVDGDFIITFLTQSSETGKNDEKYELHASAIDTETYFLKNHSEQFDVANFDGKRHKNVL